MNAPFRVAFVGGSIQSAIGLVHNVAIRMDRRFHLVAGCFSRNDEVNRQTGYEWGVAERTYSRFTEMLQSERSQLDAVVILTPVFSHAEVITAALVSGLAVVSEKPLVSNLGEIQKIKDALVQSECPLFVTFNYTGYPMIRELRARIARGDLGRIHSIRATMQQEGYLRRTHSGEVIAPQSWRLDDRDIPTVSLDLGAHVINLQNFLMRSKPIQIASRMNSFGAFPNVVDDVDVMYYTENGCFVHGWWGKSSLGYPNGLSIEVFGSEGSAKWIQMDPELLSLANSSGERFEIHRGTLGCLVAGDKRYSRFNSGHPSGFIEAFANIYCDIADSLSTRDQMKPEPKSSEFVFGVDDSESVTYILSRAAIAATAREWIEL